MRLRPPPRTKVAPSYDEFVTPRTAVWELRCCAVPAQAFAPGLENANDDPPVEQPEALLRAARRARERLTVGASV